MTDNDSTICITGGIGAGKSTVCRIVRALGYPVYDCDSRAKTLMDTDPAIRQQLAQTFGPEILLPASIDRARLSAIVFADPAQLRKLNDVVHSAVRRDIARWKTETPGLKFIETAILAESSLAAMVDGVWQVTAPQAIRIERVMRRSNLTADQVCARIEAQNNNPIPGAQTIVNDGIRPLLPQVLEIL